MPLNAMEAPLVEPVDQQFPWITLRSIPEFWNIEEDY